MLRDSFTKPICRGFLKQACCRPGALLPGVPFLWPRLSRIAKLTSSASVRLSKRRLSADYCRPATASNARRYGIMMSSALGTAMPSAGSWNCIAVAAPNSKQAKRSAKDFPFAEDNRSDREIAGASRHAFREGVDVADRQKGASERRHEASEQHNEITDAGDGQHPTCRPRAARCRPHGSQRQARSCASRLPSARCRGCSSRNVTKRTCTRPRDNVNRSDTPRTNRGKVTRRSGANVGRC